MTTTPALEVSGLEFRYGDRVVLENVSFSVRRSELFFIAGVSGSGKSTLLRLLLGLTSPSRGAIRYDGTPFLCLSREDRRKYANSVGVVFQSNALWSSMTIEENVALPLEEHAPAVLPEDRRRLVSLRLAQVGLPGVEDLTPSELSGGMRKRAALARAIALDPAVLFLDEPSSGLDPVSLRQLNDLILGLRERLGTTMVIVSHHVDSILAIGDRVILLDAAAKGIIAEGRPRELARDSGDERVRAFFGSAVA